jgi:hypothetical protein
MTTMMMTAIIMVMVIYQDLETSEDRENLWHLILVADVAQVAHGSRDGDRKWSAATAVVAVQSDGAAQ